jgi:hypothetical protein
LLPGVAPPDPPLQWQDLIPQWRETLAALAREFLTGHAAVSPKRYPHTCAYCEVAPLCRVRELFDRGPVSGDDGAADRETDVERADD